VISVPFVRRLIASLTSAAAAVLAAHVATLFIYFIGNGFDSSLFGVANAFFGMSSLIAFVLLVIGIYLTELARWYRTLIVGIVAAVIGIFIGTLLSAVAGGTPVSGDLAGGILASYGGVNLPLLLSLVLATVALAPAVYDRIVSARPAKLRAGKVALVRLPSANLADGAVTHLDRVAIDTDLADSQWAAYVDALRGAGWTIVEVAPADDLADSVFVEDAVITVGDLAILTRPGTEHRLAEVEDVESAVRTLGMPKTRIVEPGTLDGGDVLQVGEIVYVGVGGRTNSDGVRQLRDILRPAGRSVVAVPVTGVLHLKSAVTALPDGTVIGYGAHVDPRLFDRYLEVPEEAGAHVVALGEDTVLIASSAPRSAALIESLGYRVVQVDISEFEKLEGCVTCLSVRIA